MKGIDVIVEQTGSRYQIAVVRVLGQIDTTTSHELERRLQFLLKDHQFQIVIDLSKVSYISSAGWGIFISEIRGIRESGGDLKLTGMTPEVAEVFELLEFHNILESFRTVQEAVEHFEKPKAVEERNQGRAESSASDKPREQDVEDGEIDATAAAGRQDETSTQGNTADVTAVSRSGDLQCAAPEASVVTGIAEPEGETLPEAVNEAELEIVDPLHPDVKRQIRAEVVEESPTDGDIDPWQNEEQLQEQAGDELIGATDAPSAQGLEAASTQEWETDTSEEGKAQEVDAAQAETRESPAVQSVSREFQQMILETVKENPEFGCLKIRGELVKRGYRKPINPLSLFMELKRLNLETKDKRRRYADSQSNSLDR